MINTCCRLLFAFTLAVTLAGCKLALMVSSGGDVTSASGNHDCAGGSTCEIEITGPDFNETFTAVAREGYEFANWEEGLQGERFQCAGSTNPVCVVNNTLVAGNAAAEAYIEHGTIYYLMPRFEFVGIDTDGDGIKDHLDEDDDNDGVLDDDDDCPLEGPSEDGFGCPATRIPVTISFDNDSGAYTGGPVTATVTVGGGSLFYNGTEDAIGVGSNVFNGAIAQGETLSVSFDQAVTVKKVYFRQWENPAIVTYDQVLFDYTPGGSLTFTDSGQGVTLLDSFNANVHVDGFTLLPQNIVTAVYLHSIDIEYLVFP